MSDQSPDLSTLLAECEQAHQMMTPGPLAYEIDDEGDSMGWISVCLPPDGDRFMPPLPIFNVRGDSAQQAINAESVVTLVNAYPALRDALAAHQFCHLAGLFDPTGVKLGMLKRAMEDKDAEITRMRDELNTTRPYRELWEASETERNVVECERDRLRSLIARTVVVMDGSWDMLPPDEEEALARELRAVALTDAPAPPRTD